MEIEMEMITMAVPKEKISIEKTEKTQNLWISITKDIWIEIFLYISDLKELSKLKRVCKFFQKHISTELFFKKWNSIYLHKEIYPFETNSDLFKRMQYRINFESGKSFKKTMVASQKDGKFKWQKISLSNHLWEPFYLIIKLQCNVFNKKCILVQLFKEKNFVKEEMYEISQLYDAPKSSIPGYLFLVMETKLNFNTRIIAISTRKNLKNLYYDIPFTGNEFEMKNSGELFSLKLIQSQSQSPKKICLFFTFRFSDFRQQGKEGNFKTEMKMETIKKEIHWLHENDNTKMSHNSICCRQEHYKMFSFSFNETLNMEKNTQLSLYFEPPFFIFNEEEEFLIGEYNITRCKTKQTKKFKKNDSFNYSDGFINKHGNIILFTNVNCICLDIKIWDLHENIVILWEVSLSTGYLFDLLWTRSNESHLFFSHRIGKEKGRYYAIEKKELNSISDLLLSNSLDDHMYIGNNRDPLYYSPFMMLKSDGNIKDDNFVIYYFDFLHFELS